MKALLLKDGYILLRQMKIFLVILIVFTLLPDSLPGIAIMYGAIMPISLLSIDENTKWPSLAAMLPYKTRDLVLSKYCMGYLICVASAILATAVRLGYGVFSTDPDMTISLPFFCTILLALHLAALFIAVNLPLMFKLGVERGRIAYLVSLLLLMFLIGYLINGTTVGGSGEFTNLTLAPQTLLSGLLLALPVTAAISAASIAISVRVYAKRLQTA